MGPQNPGARRYTPDHVWIDDEGFVGVTHVLVEALPTPTHVHLPEAGTEVKIAEPFGALEGDKGVLDLHAPCDGRVVAVNEVVRNDPAVLLVDAAVWLLQLHGQPARLLSYEEYRARARRPLRRG